MNDPKPTNAEGINVIGHVAANLGVGVATRQVIKLIEGLGHPVAAFDVDRGTRRERSDLTFEYLTRSEAVDLPYSINLFVLGLGAIDWTLRKCPDRFFDGSCLNAIICFWELPVASKSRLAQLDQFDIVIGASDFLRHVFQQSMSHATVLAGYLPISLAPSEVFDRRTIGIPDHATAFCFSFDPASDVQRKNPHAIVTAFCTGVGDEQDAWLVLRVNNAKDVDGRSNPAVEALRQTASSHPRIVFVTERMSYPQVLGLYQACDVYVSLHRAEGLGLGMAEAMTLGIPVIATGWSGNLTFMRHTTACLVRYRFVPVEGSAPTYRERDMIGEPHWAEADVTHAAALMAYLAKDREARDALGRAAAAGMEVFNQSAWRAIFIDEIYAVHRRRQALRAIGYTDGCRIPGRPSLELPKVPLAERTRSNLRALVERATRKLGKTFRAKR